jgi:hypothetical protein
MRNGIDQSALREAYRKLICDLDPNFFITFAFHNLSNPEAGIPRMEEFCMKWERRGAGRRFYRKSAVERLIVFGFPEQLRFNAHWHAVARATERMELALRDHGTKIWREICPGGDIDFVKIEKNRKKKIENYCTKRIHVERHQELTLAYGPLPRVKPQICLTG